MPGDKPQARSPRDRRGPGHVPAPDGFRSALGQSQRLVFGRWRPPSGGFARPELDPDNNARRRNSVWLLSRHPAGGGLRDNRLFSAASRQPEPLTAAKPGSAPERGAAPPTLHRDGQALQARRRDYRRLPNNPP